MIPPRRALHRFLCGTAGGIIRCSVKTQTACQRIGIEGVLRNNPTRILHEGCNLASCGTFKPTSLLFQTASTLHWEFCLRPNLSKLIIVEPQSDRPTCTHGVCAVHREHAGGQRQPAIAHMHIFVKTC